MELNQEKIGFVSSGGGVLTFYNLGFLYGLLKYHCDIRRISGASGGIISLLPFFTGLQDGCAKFDLSTGNEKAIEFIKREMFTLNEILYLFSPFSSFSFSEERVFQAKLNMAFSLDIDINENFINREYVSTISWHKDSMPDIYISISSLKADWGIKNRIFHANAGMFVDENTSKHETNKKQQDNFNNDLLAKIIKATGTIVTVSEPVINPDEENEHWIDGGYTNNSPMSQMFDKDEKEGKKSPKSIDSIIVFDYSSQKAYIQEIKEIKRLEKLSQGASRLNPIVDRELNVISFLLSIFGTNAQLIKRTADINKFVQAYNAVKKGATEKDPVKIGDRYYYYKKIYVIKPGQLPKNGKDSKKKDHMRIQTETSEENALYNYEMGKEEAKAFMEMDGHKRRELLTENIY